jgi:anti-sigma factor RsiW
MTITKDVITDLLPLYFAGEASADTRTLLEEYLRQHPEFATAVRAQAERSAALLSGSLDVPLPKDLEKVTLQRVRHFNRARHYLLVVAVAFMLLPFSFSFAFGANRVTWILFRDNPTLASILWTAAAGCGITYRALGRRLA